MKNLALLQELGNLVILMLVPGVVYSVTKGNDTNLTLKYLGKYQHADFSWSAEFETNDGGQILLHTSGIALYNIAWEMNGWLEPQIGVQEPTCDMIQQAERAMGA